MRTRTWYDLEAKRVQTGTGIGARIRKAGRMFSKFLGVGERLLDVGCGVGDYAVYLGKIINARELHGIDIAQARVDHARSKGIHAAIIDINCDPLPYPDDHFDAVFFGEILEHLVDSDHALRELRRVLAPLGLLVITTPNLSAWMNRLCLAFGFQPFYTDVSFEFGDSGKLPLARGRSSGTHLRVLTHRALCELLRYHRFQLVASGGCSLYDTFGSDVPKRIRWPVQIMWPIDYLLSLRPSLAPISIVAARKIVGYGERDAD